VPTSRRLPGQRYVVAQRTFQFTYFDNDDDDDNNNNNNNNNNAFVERHSAVASEALAEQISNL